MDDFKRKQTLIAKEKYPLADASSKNPFFYVLPKVMKNWSLNIYQENF